MGSYAILTTALAPLVPAIGNPGVLETEAVWISENQRGDWAPEVTGSPTPTMTEAMELEVVVWTSQAGDDYVRLRDRAATLGALIEAAVMASPTLGGSVLDCYVLGVERGSGANAWDAASN